MRFGGFRVLSAVLILVVGASRLVWSISKSVAYHKSTIALYNAVGQAYRDKDELVIEPAPFMMPIESESDDPFWDGMIWADLD